MLQIKLKTEIKADRKIVFDLARSIDLHKISTSHTNEKAIAGVVSGLIGLDQTVTWKATHFGISQKLTSKISEYKSPDLFVDEMVSGAFKRLRHEHHFTDFNDKTIMIDVFDYTSPMGFLGKLADVLFLKTYLTKLLKKRNAVIKEFAESEKWMQVLPQ